MSELKGKYKQLDIRFASMQNEVWEQTLAIITLTETLEAKCDKPEELKNIAQLCRAIQDHAKYLNGFCSN